MLFNSLEFLIFFAIVYGLYLLLNRQHQWQNYMLLVASCIFYGAWDWRFLFLIFTFITMDFLFGLKIYEAKNEKTRKQLLALSITINLSILGFFKYFNFFVDSFCGLLNFFHIPFSLVTLHILLPVGISFYTFQSMSYTIDVYRNKMIPTKRFWDYALFVTYFPHLVAGPIMRAKDLLPQVLSSRKLSLEKFYEGSFLVFWGLFEKIFIADNLAKIVNPIFASPPPYNGGEVWVALYAFSFQIFCDFDAYSNMARGLGKCMGFEILYNFNLPYFSTNPREFWQRWHISLSSWLKGYLYISLGGNRQSEMMTYRNLAITMLLGGLWHGASWTFILWGAYHGLLLIVYRYFPVYRGEVHSTPPMSRKWFIPKVILFFHLVTLGWLLFRAQSIHQVAQMVSALLFSFSVDHATLSLFLRFLGFVVPLIMIQLGQFKTDDLMFLYRRHWLIKTIAYALMSYAMLSWGVMKAEEFIYFQF